MVRLTASSVFMQFIALARSWKSRAVKAVSVLVAAADMVVVADGCGGWWLVGWLVLVALRWCLLGEELEKRWKEMREVFLSLRGCDTFTLTDAGQLHLAHDLRL